MESQKAELYVFSTGEFLTILIDLPDLCLNFARILCNRINETTNRLIKSLSDYHSYLKDKERFRNLKKKADILKPAAPV